MRLAFCLLLALPVLASASALPQAAIDSDVATADVATAPSEQPTARLRTMAAVGGMAGFVENKGQWPEEVLFFARFGGVELTLTREALVFREAPQFVDPRARSTERPEIRPAGPPLVLRLPSSSSEVAVSGVAPGVTLHHFIKAAGSGRNARGFDRVLYRGIQPGLDLRVRLDATGFAYDLLAAPGTPLEDFYFDVEGAAGIDLKASGRLGLDVAGSLVDQRIGACWQQAAGGERVAVDCSFRLISEGADGLRFGFKAPGWDRTQSLVLDPTVIYSTYVGGSPPELFKEIAVDAAGSAFLLANSITGTPTTPGALQTSSAAPFGDYWIGKLSPDGSQLEWATFLGGTHSQRPEDILVDTDGSVVVLGTTWSSDFPTTPGAIQTATQSPGEADVTISRLDPTGSSLVWSTLFGGTWAELGTAMEFLPSGDLAVAIEPLLGDLTATPGAFDEHYDPSDKMLLGISSDGSTLNFATFFHVSGIWEITTDEEGSIYLAGEISAPDLPLVTTPGVLKQSSIPGGFGDGFISKFNSTGSQLIWSTYFGGDQNGDNLRGLAVDAAHAVYVSGGASSTDFPVTPGAFSTTSFGPGGDAYVAKILPDASGIVWSTLIGGCCGGGQALYSLSVDAAGNAVAAGSTNQPNWPTTADALQPIYVGPFPEGDIILTKFDAMGEALVYSTYIAGTGTDYQTRLDLDQAGNAYVAGYSSSTDLPTTPGAYQPSKTPGYQDMMVAAFDLPLAPWRVLGFGLAGSTAPNLAGTGTMSPGALTRLSLRGGIPGAQALAVGGFSEVLLPIAGGILLPSPDKVLSVPLDANGAFDFTFTWPGFPIDVFFQVWIPDPQGPQGWIASNAVRAIGQ